MKREQLYKTASQLIAQNKTEEVFVLLKSESLDPPTSQAITLLQSEFNNLQQSELKGLLTFQEVQIQKNKINDKLLAILRKDPAAIQTSPLKSNLVKKLLPIVLFIAAFGFWWLLSQSPFSCPEFDTKVNNKIMVIPFVKVAGEDAKPQVSLRNRINQLTKDNDLSADVKLCEVIDNISMDNALELAKQCEVDLLVWGTYSAREDSIRLILQYYFLEQPEWSNSGELITLKDVTGLQQGKMLKSLDDAIFSLCGVVALRDGNNVLAKKWFVKVKEKEKMDEAVLKALE